VVLENTSGVAALKRSKNLGKDYYLRTFGLFLLMTLFAALFGGVVGGVFGFLFQGQLPIFLLTAIQILVQPLALIMIVLSYYDLRARKEAYDTTALAEDLQH
jgi:hypothetical protein